MVPRTHTHRDEGASRCAAFILWDSLTRNSVLFFGERGFEALAPNEVELDLPTQLAPSFQGTANEDYSNESCPLQDLQCVPRKRRVRLLIIPALVLAALLVLFFLTDVLRARHRATYPLSQSVRA